ncbi:CotH kinase family protein [Sphingobacterium sp. UBA5980]|uniref:CotH kinase family protein n=1 Tax=Sphingobacterium sp. UBA5980 TaxID=1947504 RepID=UPI00257C5707|nr:CotH kinase family protein [Sphingobacterium sp. UBA5980]
MATNENNNKEFVLDQNTPLEPAANVHGLLAVTKTGESGAVGLETIATEAGKKIGEAVKVTGTELPKLGEANKIATIYGGEAGKIMSFNGTALPAIGANKVASFFWDGSLETWEKIDEVNVKGDKGVSGQGKLILWSTDHVDAESGQKGYMENDQVRDSNGVTYVSLKDGNTSALSVTADWLSIGIVVDQIFDKTSDNAISPKALLPIIALDNSKDLTGKLNEGAYWDLQSERVVGNANYCYSDNIDVKDLDRVLVSLVIGGGNGIALFNDNKQVISKINNETLGVPSDSQIENVEIDVSSASSLLFSSKINAVNKVTTDSSFTKIITHTELLKKWEVSDLTNIYGSLQDNKDKKVLPNGTDFDDFAWDHSNKINVEENDVLDLNLRGDGSAVMVLFFTSDNTTKVLKTFNENIENIKAKVTIPEKGQVIIQNRKYEYTGKDLYANLLKNNRETDAAELYSEIEDLKKNRDSSDKFTGRDLYLERPDFFRLDLTGSLPVRVEEPIDTTTLDAKILFNNRVMLYCDVDATIQGHGSATYTMKGLTLDFKNKEGKSVAIQFGNMVSADSYHLKAYATDRTHTRDVGSGRLWRDMINQLPYPLSKVNNKAYTTKKGGKTADIDILNAQYFTDGIPCEVYLNGGFYGLYTMRLKKNRDNYALNRDNLNHIFLDSATYSAYLSQPFKASDWEVKSPRMAGYVDQGEIPNETVLANINRLFNFTRWFNSNNSFNPNHVDYIVLEHWLCWYIHAELIGNVDTDGNNYNIFTWNSSLFTITPYDMDLTIGLNAWNGYIIEETKSGYLINHDIWGNFRTSYLAQIKALYKKMRESGFISTTNIVNYYVNQGKCIPRKVYEENRKKWASIWNNDEPNIEQIGLWISSRITYLDSVWL